LFLPFFQEPRLFKQLRKDNPVAPKSFFSIVEPFFLYTFLGDFTILVSKTIPFPPPAQVFFPTIILLSFVFWIMFT